MPPLSGHRPNILVAITLSMLLLAATVHLLTFWPGIMVWDPIRQYGQALTGDFDDWHPPAMGWLWRQLGMFGPGPSPMLVVEGLLYWSGFAALAARRAFQGEPVRAAAIVVLALMPISLVLLGTILKDSLMAGTLLLATGLIAWRRPGDRVLGVAAVVFLIGAATLRFNAVPACLPLLLPLLPQRWRVDYRRLAAVAAGATMLLALTLPFANYMIGAKRTHVELSLMIYDLGGITRYSGVDVFPPAGVADPVAVNDDCYTPIAWDSYAWWHEDPCAIGFTNLKPILLGGPVPATWVWARAVVHHPVAYAEHRFAHFNQEARFVTSDPDLPPLSFVSDPNVWGYQVPPNRLRDAIAWAAQTSLDDTPFGWPICWLALAGSVLLVATGGDMLATALASSSLLYGFSFLPLGVASEPRYHLWTMIAAGLSAAMALGRGRSIARYRLIAAWALPIGVAIIGGAARVFLSGEP